MMENTKRWVSSDQWGDGRDEAERRVETAPWEM
jgi:hypothetical protein